MAYTDNLKWIYYGNSVPSHLCLSCTKVSLMARPKLTDYSKIKNIAALVGNSGRWTIDEIAIVQD